MKPQHLFLLLAAIFLVALVWQLIALWRAPKPTSPYQVLCDLCGEYGTVQLPRSLVVHPDCFAELAPYTGERHPGAIPWGLPIIKDEHVPAGMAFMLSPDIVKWDPNAFIHLRTTDDDEAFARNEVHVLMEQKLALEIRPEDHRKILRIDGV